MITDVTLTIMSISEPDQLYAIPLLVNHVSCNGLSDGSATSIGVGGTVAADYTYLWDDPSTQATAIATNLAAGTPLPSQTIMVVLLIVLLILPNPMRLLLHILSMLKSPVLDLVMDKLR